MVIDLALMQKELIRDEGIRYTAYQDTLGYWTIGVGHLLPGPTTEVWSHERVLKTLEIDIDQSLQDIKDEPWYLACRTPIQQRGLCNMRFQLGSRGIRTFKNSLRLVAQQRFKEAGVELRKSKWYSQTPARAERVIRQIEG